jgi:hypothetical protein
MVNFQIRDSLVSIIFPERLFRIHNNNAPDRITLLSQPLQKRFKYSIRLINRNNYIHCAFYFHRFCSHSSAFLRYISYSIFISHNYLIQVMEQILTSA